MLRSDRKSEAKGEWILYILLRCPDTKVQFSLREFTFWNLLETDIQTLSPFQFSSAMQTPQLLLSPERPTFKFNSFSCHFYWGAMIHSAVNNICIYYFNNSYTTKVTAFHFHLCARNPSKPEILLCARNSSIETQFYPPALQFCCFLPFVAPLSCFFIYHIWEKLFYFCSFDFFIIKISRSIPHSSKLQDFHFSWSWVIFHCEISTVSLSCHLLLALELVLEVGYWEYNTLYKKVCQGTLVSSSGQYGQGSVATSG